MSSDILATGSGLSDLLTHPFMVNALLAGIPIAALAGLVGYFMVLRSQVFTGDGRLGWGRPFRQVLPRLTFFHAARLSRPINCVGRRRRPG